MRAPKVVDPMVEAERGVLAASLAVEALAGELARAEEEANKVAARFLRDASELDANVKAAMLRDRAGALHLEAIAALDLAKARKASLDRERLLAQHERDLAELPRWKEKLDHGPLIAVDAQLDEVVLRQYCEPVLASQRAWDEANTRALALGLRTDLLPPRPELADAQLASSSAARLAREAANRDCLSDWLAPELGAGNWKIGEELTAAQRHALLVQGANIAAAQLSQHSTAAPTEGE